MRPILLNLHPNNSIQRFQRPTYNTWICELHTFCERQYSNHNIFMFILIHSFLLDIGYVVLCYIRILTINSSSLSHLFIYLLLIQVGCLLYPLFLYSWFPLLISSFTNLAHQSFCMPTQDSQLHWFQSLS